MDFSISNNEIIRRFPWSMTKQKISAIIEITVEQRKRNKKAMEKMEIANAQKNITINAIISLWNKSQSN